MKVVFNLFTPDGPKKLKTLHVDEECILPQRGETVVIGGRVLVVNKIIIDYDEDEVKVVVI